MMSFVELTKYPKGTRIWVNLDKVQCMERSEEVTMIGMSIGYYEKPMTIKVIETPEEIMQKQIYAPTTQPAFPVFSTTDGDRA